VYDITEFVDQHPGGMEKIMLAAGTGEKKEEQEKRKKKKGK
jgi:cytochrome b involved in lipid metabolism